MLIISLWTKQSGNALSHAGGLTADQVKELQELKVGDRVILFVNKDPRSDKSPQYNLRKFNGTEGGGQGSPPSETF